MKNIKVWKEKVIIPTYGIGKPEKNPVFCEKRVYQGSSGVVYPLPVIEKIFDEKEDKEWTALFLENKYLKIMILPEIGGRVQRAYDKIKKRDFIYYNSVIKPALVGLTGPWISGGLEFNWPQHHRPSTYDPVDYIIEENNDGSKTIWCSEVERMFRTKGMTGFTLYPDKAYLEIKVKLYNRTEVPQTFLWWANPAVKVNDHYQSVFPPDVNAVYDHGKRDVSKFPIADGTYYKVDYSAGVDISRYKNIPVPTSYMAVGSKYNFVGAYENDSKGGMLHWADRHVSTGKKQWTWGKGDFGYAWDRNLTDEDGPYAEIMCGVFADNQPDFSWIMPNEEKSFNQYYMPYQNLGVIKNASKDAMLNLEFDRTLAKVKIYTTAHYPGLQITLKAKNKLLIDEVIDSSPEMSFEKSVEFAEGLQPQDFYVSVKDKNGKTLVEYRPEKEIDKPIPKAAEAAKQPEDITSIEQLYLTGLHIEQFRHATYNPTQYYNEALKHEPGDVRCNNAMGLWFYRRGQLTKAEYYFRKAIETLTQRNPNPYDGEPFYNLGLSLLFQEKDDEAFDAFYKSVWNGAWQESGYFSLAKIASKRKDFDEALDLVDKSLIRNWHNHKARHLKVIVLRKLGRNDEALNLCEESLKIDRFNFGVIYEKYLITKSEQTLTELLKLMRNYVHNFIEYSLDYAHAGMYQEASSLIQLYLDNNKNPYPMAGYFQGWYALKNDDIKDAEYWFKKASQMNADGCFPNRLEEVLALQSALEINPEDPKAYYYLGNFWYGARQYENATECWEKSRNLDNSFPTVKRNLALAYFNKKHDATAALRELEEAFNLDTSDARIFMELDQLYKKLGKSHQFRLSFFEKYPENVAQRDDTYLERITLFNQTGQFEKALELLLNHKFHPWEGGEGKVTGQYLIANIELAKMALKTKEYKKAIEFLSATQYYPHNLGEGKLYVAQENDIDYWMGCAYEGLGDMEKANASWKKASTGMDEPVPAIFYNDQQPDKILYQGLALIKLAKPEKANQRFKKLIEYGEKHIDDDVKIDYFAVSLPDLLIWEEDLNKRNKINCTYLIGLGFLGLENFDKAKEKLQKVIKMDINHQGALAHLSFNLYIYM